MQKIVLVCSVMIVVWLKMKTEKHMAALCHIYVHIHPLPSIYQGNICREIELFVCFRVLWFVFFFSYGVRYAHADIGICQRATLSHCFLVY